MTDESWGAEIEREDKTGVTESTIRIWTYHKERRPTSEMRGIGQAVTEAGKVVERSRWDVERTGEREPIIWPVRRAVAMRDDFTCQRCHRSDGMRAELDHIIPWSAGGGDDSTNLRYLCYECNQERSNRFDGTEDRPMREVTWWCLDCYSPEMAMPRAVLRYGNKADDWLNIGHRVENAFVRAYCAKCRHLAWTDVTL